MITSAAAGVADFAWGMSLGFALALVSVVSLAMVLSLPESALHLGKPERRLRNFKGREVKTELKYTAAKRRSLPQVSLAYVPEGLDLTVKEKEGGFELTGVSKFAGAYTGVRVSVGVGDPLGVMTRYEIRELETAFEFLPMFLVEARSPVLVSAAMLGDYPAGRSGFGQEFYSASEYTSSHGMKDIMWKRLARSPDGRPMARVGEANVPERVTVAFLEKASASNRRNPSWMNLVSEAVARIGISVVTTGSTLRLLHVMPEGTAVHEARDSTELADLVMALWKDHPSRALSGEELGQSDMLLAGEEEMGVQETRAMVLRKPTIVLSWVRAKPVAGPSVFNFTGSEDISKMVVGVLSR